MKTNAVFAALNDDKALNNHRFRDLIIEANDNNPLEEVSLESFQEYLKAKSVSDDEVSSTAKRAIETLEKKDLSEYESYISKLADDNIDLISILDSEYPEGLSQIEELPLLLYVDGDRRTWDNGIAVVGTRQANDHRLKKTEEIARHLVKQNLTVISGLANGVDERAHETALDAGGKTIAVLPGDIETITPKSNLEIGEKIPSQGCLVSEVSEDIGVNKRRFVERNRVTSGLSQAVVIAASGETGGTVHQAKFAKSQKTPIFLYDPEASDGQSPEKIKNMGAHCFADLDELDFLLESLEDNSLNGYNRTFDSYS